MNSKLPVCVSCCVLLASLFNSSCGTRRSGPGVEKREIEIIGAKDTVAARPVSAGGKIVPDEVLASAHRLVPGFEIEAAEREREDGEVVWSLEGKAKGQPIELELAEADIAGR